MSQKWTDSLKIQKKKNNFLRVREKIIGHVENRTTIGEDVMQQPPSAGNGSPGDAPPIELMRLSPSSFAGSHSQEHVNALPSAMKFSDCTHLSARNHPGDDASCASDADDDVDVIAPAPLVTSSKVGGSAASIAGVRRHATSTVRFQLPFMAQCNIDAALGDECKGGASQDEISGPVGSKDFGRQSGALGSSQTSADRSVKSSVSSELGSLSGLQLAAGWRRPTLYRCMESSQDLKLALSFDKFRHNAAK
jgi:hypothetical protein